MYMRALGDPSQGFFNAIAFVAMTPTVRTRLVMRVKGYTEDEMTLTTGGMQQSMFGFMIHVIV